MADVEAALQLLAEALELRPDDPRALRTRDDLEQEQRMLHSRGR
jgi:hypothetical protein